MILVDTSGWYASIIATDPAHAAVVEWLEQSTDTLLTTDYIVDETLTLLLVRGHKDKAIRWAEQILAGNLCTVHYVTESEFLDAWYTFRDYVDKQWSFTDCVSKVIVKQLGISQALSLDEHFRQFGSVTVVPSIRTV